MYMHYMSKKAFFFLQRMFLLFYFRAVNIGAIVFNPNQIFIIFDFDTKIYCQNDVI